MRIEFKIALVSIGCSAVLALACFGVETYRNYTVQKNIDEHFSKADLTQTAQKAYETINSTPEPNDLLSTLPTLPPDAISNTVTLPSGAELRMTTTSKAASYIALYTDNGAAIDSLTTDLDYIYNILIDNVKDINAVSVLSDFDFFVDIDYNKENGFFKSTYKIYNTDLTNEITQIYNQSKFAK